MWIWWIISLIVLIVCFIFAYRVIMSSYDFLPGDKKNFLKFRRNAIPDNHSEKNEIIWDLKNKLQKVEENSTFYELQFSKLLQRLKSLEENASATPLNAEEKDKADEENWKEMYYEENEIKEKLENELDEVRQKLEDAENDLKKIEDSNSKWGSLKSDYDARLNDLHSMQNNIGLLQRQLEASEGRAKELEQSLSSGIHVKNQLAQLQNEYARIKNENDELKSLTVQMSNREKELELGINRLNELESKLSVYEEEKAKMIADLEQMVNQNKSFSPSNNS